MFTAEISPWTAVALIDRLYSSMLVEFDLDKARGFYKMTPTVWLPFDEAAAWQLGLVHFSVAHHNTCKRRFVEMFT